MDFDDDDTFPKLQLSTMANTYKKLIKVSGTLYVADARSPTYHDKTIPIYLYEPNSGRYMGTFDRSKLIWTDNKRYKRN